MKNAYFLLRHGESLRNIKDVVACWPEKTPMPLTKKGKRDIKKIAQKLRKIHLIFSSDLLRTKQTAEIVAKELGIRPKFDKRLREVNTGILNGSPIGAVGRLWDPEGKLDPYSYYQKRFKIRLTKGETYKELEKRMHSILLELEKKYKNKNILLISHARPITMLEKVAYNYSHKKFVDIIMQKKEIKTGEVRKLKKWR